MSRVLVLGASGLLGASLVPALRDAGHDVLAQSRGAQAAVQLEPSDRDATAQALAKLRPDVIVNLIAATNVDQCEGDPAYAWCANVAPLESIVTGLRDVGARPHLVHVSSDQVYDGPGPHVESQVRPINVYGLSKYTGELVAAQVGATVLRANFFGRSRCAGRTSFSDWIVRNLRERKPITAFNDVLFSALHLSSLCGIIALAIRRRPAGVFNVGCRDGISKAGFALRLATGLQLPLELITVGSSADVALRARRPLDMTMNVSRLERALDIVCPMMSEEIERTMKEYL